MSPSHCGKRKRLLAGLLRFAAFGTSKTQTLVTLHGHTALFVQWPCRISDSDIILGGQLAEELAKLELCVAHWLQQ